MTKNQCFICGEFIDKSDTRDASATVNARGYWEAGIPIERDRYTRGKHYLLCSQHRFALETWLLERRMEAKA